MHREFRPTGRDSPVDYALKLMCKPQLFLEAKGLGEALADRRWIAQVLGYATVAGVEWCVLTDGDEYRFYNATAPIDADEKMFLNVRLTEADGPEAERALSLISRSNLEQNQLDVLWVSHFVDRRVKAALDEMLAVPDAGIIRRVRQRVPKVTTKAVADSIRRLDITVALPELLPEPRAVKADEPRPRRPRTGAKRPGAPAGARVALIDIIRAGLVQPPLRLFCRYKGHDLEATLLHTSEVEFQGTRHATCSAAAEAARASVTGRKMNTNGWTFWQFIDAAGQARRLDDMRQQLARREGGTPPLRLTGSDEGTG